MAVPSWTRPGSRLVMSCFQAGDPAGPKAKLLTEEEFLPTPPGS